MVIVPICYIIASMGRFTDLLVYSDRLLFRLARHLFLVISMILLFSWIVFIRNDDETFYHVIQGVSLNALFFFGYAYLTAYIFVPVLIHRKKYVWFIVIFLATGFAISYLKFIFSDFLFYTAIATEFTARFKLVEFSYLITNTKDMTFIVSLFLIAKFAKDNHHLQLRLRELQDHQLRSEIKLLKHQLDPHVIFNNLNNLYSLSINNSKKVGESIHKFHSLLEYYFIIGKAQQVPLKTEIQTIGDFIALEKLRYGERLDVSIDIEGKEINKKIIPFVFFSFIENCFDHGCSIESGNSWIRILVKVEKDAILFHAANSKPQNVLEAGHLKDPYLVTRQKMDLLYPGKYLLRIDDLPDQYFLDLKLRI